MPVIYVNDNFGRWQSDWRRVIALCSAPRSPGRRIVARLRPGPTDYFVLKPKHSNTRGKTEFTLRQIREVLKGETPSSVSLTRRALEALRAGRAARA